MGRPRTGRPRGRPPVTKYTAEARGIARALLSDPIYRNNLIDRLREGRAAPLVETTLWAYAYGRPLEQLQIDKHVTHARIILQRVEPTLREVHAIAEEAGYPVPVLPPAEEPPCDPATLSNTCTADHSGPSGPPTITTKPHA